MHINLLRLPPYTPLQLRKKSHPRIKYFEAKARSKHSPFREQEITEPAVDDTLWPTESGQGEALAGKEFDLTARTTSLLNLDSSWLADVLSEKPTSEDQKGPASGPQLPAGLKSQVQSAKVVVPQVSNNNFSLSF